MTSKYVCLVAYLALSAGPFAASCAPSEETPGGDVLALEGPSPAGGGVTVASLTAPPAVNAFGFSATPVGNALASYVAAELSVQGASVASRSAATAYLRAHPSEVTSELLAAYDRLPEGQYQARWYIVRTLSALELREAAGALDSIVQREVPPERWAPAPHGKSSVREEEIVRARAIGGLRSLAIAGSPEASAALRRALSSPLVPVKMAATQAYLAAGRRSTARVAEARALLPPDQQRWVDLRPATATDLAVPTPEAPPSGDPSPVDLPAR
ncbi:MAG TPA: hypothetical protein VFS43_12020 [Polyangiaceae bacterium]|nr:hypothetical protein [Polyangiaceae bacterium]